MAGTCQEHSFLFLPVVSRKGCLRETERKKKKGSNERRRKAKRTEKKREKGGRKERERTNFSNTQTGTQHDLS